MTIKIYPATAIEIRNQSWLIYGRSGSGKTTLVGTFPRPLLVVNFVCEAGARTLRGLPKCDIVDVETPQDMNEAFEYIVQNHAKYRTVAIDSLTSLVEILYRRTRAKRMVERNDWLDWRSKIYEFAERMRRLPVETVFTATQSANVDEATGAKFGGPNLFGSLEAGFPARMDIVVWMECETDENGVPTFTAYLSGRGSMIGRARGALPAGRIESPTYAAIMERIKDPLFKVGESEGGNSGSSSDRKSEAPPASAQAEKQAS